MSKLNGTTNGKAPTVPPVEAHLEVIEDALLCGSIDAAAQLAQLTARGKPVHRKTKVRLRNQRRQVVLFDNALDALTALRKAWEASQAAPTAEQSAQLRLPLPANSNDSDGAHRTIVS